MPVQPVWWLAPIPGAVVAVEVLVEQQQVVPVRVGLELLDAAVTPAGARPRREERARQPVGELARHLAQVSSRPEPVGHSTLKPSP